MEQLEKLIQLLKLMESPTDSEPTNHGLCIAVLDKGFVYVGEVTTDKEFVTITSARCVRKWGTTEGLGQLAIFGPQDETLLDDANIVKALVGELKHMLICKEASWR